MQAGTSTSTSTSTSAYEIARNAKSAFELAQLVKPDERIQALTNIKEALVASRTAIFAANREDVQAAQASQLPSSLVSRLDLTKGDKWESILQGLSDVAALPDPTGIVSYAKELDESLELYRVSCPIGVLLVIFEARPEVVVNIASLAIKSGNAAILKGGKESNRTTRLLAQAISSALSKTTLPDTYIQTVQTRDDVSMLLALDQFIDLVIPRGSNALVRNIQSSTRIPVMGHADGICHVYLDETALKEKAVPVLVDSKTTYPSACNSVETLVVHEKVLDTVWIDVARALLEKDVTLLCDAPSLEALSQVSPAPSNVATHIKASKPEDYGFEHLSLTLSIQTVSSLQNAIAHINTHSSHHTDSIITESSTAAHTFCIAVDSAGTFVNASTRFADGFRYGFGTEVGISTGRIHARGPVGLDGLVSYKYMMRSTASRGHITTEFGVGEGLKGFTHRVIEGVTSLPF